MSMRTPVDLAVERCPNGYLTNPEDWTEELAQKMASEWVSLDFTEEHLDLINFMRTFYAEHHITPDVREATHYLISKGMDKKSARKHLFKLFPHGYMQQCCQIAGMRRPTSWCVG